MLTARSHLVHRIRSRLPALLVSLSLCGLAPPAADAAQQPSQSDVEAVYLFDFGKFVRWPAGADQGPLTLCVASSASFADSLQKTVVNETIGARVLQVRRVIRPDDETGCAILFIEAAQHLRSEDFLDAVADRPTLTVSDEPDFLSHGGMIQFQLVERRVRFSVDLDAVNHARLTMSSELLKVAVSVKGKMPEGGTE